MLGLGYDGIWFTSFLYSHIQFDARSHVCLHVLLSFFLLFLCFFCLCFQLILFMVNTDRPTKPLNPLWVFIMLSSPQLVVRYFLFLIGSLNYLFISSRGIVSSIMMTYLLTIRRITISGPSVVW